MRLHPLLVAPILAACQPGERAADDQAPPLYENLGTYHHAISTRVPETQAYFDQGMRLLYAFNHAEAARAFEAAERRDPTCAICAAGVALAVGPNINAPMDSASGAKAWDAVERARSRMAEAPAAERAWVEAITVRYGMEPLADRAGRDSAYARALLVMATNFPDDPDAQVLRADALMNLSPWNYWADGQPRPDTPEILERLEGVLAKNPNHPGACHLYIHAVEAQEPSKAIACAERLASLMPGAGHLVHMPGHIYIRVGRWNDAIKANQHAAHADERFFEGPRASHGGIYGYGYYPHNYHFLSFAASMAGQGELAVDAARKVAEAVNPEVARTYAWVEAVTPIVWYTLVTFGRWDAILGEPLPPTEFRLLTGMAWYARGMAYAARGKWGEATAALDTVKTISSTYPDGENRTALRIAALALEGETALRQHNLPRALDRLRAATELEDGLAYTEPPTWYYPIRQSLGKALLEAGRPAEAEAAYRHDLALFPHNGWSLKGLELSLAAQGRTEEAAAVRAEFDAAWANADIQLEASRL